MFVSVAVALAAALAVAVRGKLRLRALALADQTVLTPMPEMNPNTAKASKASTS